ncbi:MAG: peptide chain release factor N(5)-glutamine methyltransferase, partial [Oliverpabstia sp.]
MSTLRDLFCRGKEELRMADVPDAEVDAWALMEFALDIEKSYYYLHENDKIGNEQQERYETCIRQRKNRIPLQQIIGKAWFMGYEFYVNEQVLIPRFDTEILVEEVGRYLQPGMRVLDLCTGSGCILLSLLAEHEELSLKGVGADISPEALKVAAINRERLRVEADLVESDLFDNLEGVFDLIVSNPPYIAAGEIAQLMPEVKEHEPVLALDGGEDGLYFYRKIVKEANYYLNPGGWLCMEIGWDQG